MSSTSVPLVLLLLACAPRQEAPPATEGARNTEIANAAITLERTACFAGCPVYRVEVSPEGVITFEGRAHVRELGVATARVSPDRVRGLVSELDKAGYFALAGRYTAGEPVCGRYATDLPTTITSVQLGDRTKRIEHDHGCGNAPRALAVLEQRIDEVL